MIMGNKQASLPTVATLRVSPGGAGEGRFAPFEPLLRSPPDAALMPAAHRAVLRWAGIETTTTLRVSSSQK